MVSNPKEIKGFTLKGKKTERILFIISKNIGNLTVCFFHLIRVKIVICHNTVKLLFSSSTLLLSLCYKLQAKRFHDPFF